MIHRSVFPAVVFSTFLACMVPDACAQEALFVVRHAERADDSRDPDLSGAGTARARALADLLNDSGVKAIYTSTYKRTIKTAAPLAQKLGLTPSALAASDLPALVRAVRTDHPGDRVLIVGHSDTVPEILKAFGCREEITIAHDEYDNLFVLVPRGEEAPLFLRLRF